MTKKTLIIVESPAKVKTIAKVLGPDYIIRSSVGHICELGKGGSKNLGVDLDHDFALKFVPMLDKKDVIKSIQDAAASVDMVYLASDKDREGERIAADLHNVISEISRPPTLKRATFTELTKKGIQFGLKNVSEINWPMVESANARRALDRMVGYLASPFVMQNFGPKLSAGRTQSPACKLIVDREKEIRDFKPEEYWNITAALAKSTTSDSFQAKYFNKNRVVDGKSAAKIKDELERSSYQISELEEKEKVRNPYPPLITSSLAATAAGRYKFATARTMKAAQTLYESGLITYMRTDSTRISPEALEECREWLKCHKHDIPERPNHYAKSEAQDAHEAIRPTNIEKISSQLLLGEDEKKVYQLIWERFLTSQMKPALYDTVSATILADCEGKIHTLKANGRVLKYKGWLELTPIDEDDEEEGKLPLLKKNDLLILVPPKVKADQKFTQPPPRYSEKTLIKELEKRQIGRPSTYATIMTKITERAYVEKDKEMFQATDLGIQVIDSLTEHFDFIKFDYTAKMETKLDQIADGQLTYLQMMQEFYQDFASQLKNAYASKAKDYGFKCVECQEKMELKHGQFGFYMACLNRPHCRYSFSVDIINDLPVKKTSAFLAPIVPGIECPKCQAGMVKKDGKFGPFYSCVTHPQCLGTAKVPFGKKCSKCRKNEMYLTFFQEQAKLACMGYPDCKNIEEIPANSPITWKNPSELKKPEMDRKLTKIISEQKKIAASKSK